MADARALLRAARAENRISHPLAAYSDAGKLLCKLCQDVVKTESLWDMHLRGQVHRQRLQALQEQQRGPSAQVSADNTQKRKRDEDADEPMSDADPDPDTIRAKRTKTGVVPGGLGADGAKDRPVQPSPGLMRSNSGTPGHGVEIAIPSRPATPLPGSNSTVSTPKVASIGQSPLVSSGVSSNTGVSASTQHRLSTSMSISTESIVVPPQNTIDASSASNTTAAPQTSSGAVDEAEWAAFEAEMTALDAVTQPSTTFPAGGLSNPFADATISAPAMTTAQVAAKSQEEEIERMKQAAEAEMADEREEATRALETEFEEMEELEGRVRRLKERREQLRRESVMNIENAEALKAAAPDGEKENLLSGAGGGAEEEDEDDDEEFDDEWDGFRFRP